MRRVFLLFLTAVLLFTGCNTANKQADAQEAPVNTQEAKTVYIIAGKIEANEKADITSKIQARVSEINIDVGSFVKKVRRLSNLIQRI